MRRVKSHLEARDGAEFHEQHLEFRLHHVGRAPGEEVGDGRLVWSVSKWCFAKIPLPVFSNRYLYVWPVNEPPTLSKRRTG